MGGIKIGIGFGASGKEVPSARVIAGYAERAEELDIDSIWLSDHLVVRQPSLDIHCVMAAIAARTERIKMGPSVLTLPARHPLHVARTYATLDHLTGGRRRVILAVGIGASERECEASGVPRAERGARLEEGVSILRQLWAGEHVTHHGRFWSFDDVTIAPRPARGTLDVWIGGNSDVALRRVARYGDGWMPSFITPDEFRAGMARLRALGAERGREIDPGEAGVVMLAHVEETSQRAQDFARRSFSRGPVPLDALAERAAIGSPDDVARRVQAYVDAGCSKFVLFAVAPPEELVKQVELIGREVLPRFAGVSA